jgi:hypothetical protein
MKPSLPNAKVVQDVHFDEAKYRAMGLSDSAIEALKKGAGDRDPGNSDFFINARFTIHEASTTDYLHFKTEGTSTILSVYRIATGCNNLSAFREAGTEKSADYDSIPSYKIVSVSNDFNVAMQQISERYTGKTLRVVARTTERPTSFDRARYYLFVVED